MLLPNGQLTRIMFLFKVSMVSFHLAVRQAPLS
jgi:hypothetical protein